MNEYEWKVDVVMVLPDDVDPEAFFEALQDHVIEFVEKWDGRIGGSFHHGELQDEEEQD